MPLTPCLWVRLNHHFDLNYSVIKFHDYILHIFIGFIVCVPISTHNCFTVVGIFAYTSPSKLCYYQLRHRGWYCLHPVSLSVSLCV